MNEMVDKLRRGEGLWFVAYGVAFLGCAALAWLVRDAPVQPNRLGGLVRVDALSAFFVLLAVAGGALLTSQGKNPLRVVLAALALLIGFCTTHLLALVGAMLLAALLLAEPIAAERRRVGSRLAYALLAPGFLLFAYGSLWLRSGEWRYDAPLIGAAFDSVVFWLVLLAALAGGAAQLRSLSPLASIWLYPLLRLYSLGPWNTGWSFATLLVGGAAALWCAAEASRANGQASRTRWVVSAYAGASLAGAGLSSAAGVAACCYALLCVLLLIFGLPERAGSGERGAGSGERSEAERQQGEEPAPALWPALALATLSGALPITAPFVALWLLVGAAVAGGVPLLSVALWLAGLGSAFATLRAVAEEPPQLSPNWTSGRRRVVAAALSVALGVAAPAVVAWPIVPVARQLQGGLTPYGDLAIWPWVGLATLDAARQPVASLPSTALAGLMLVLASLAWLFVLLRSARRE